MVSEPLQSESMCWLWTQAQRCTQPIIVYQTMVCSPDLTLLENNRTVVSRCRSSDCLPADPVGRDAVQGKQGELKVVRGAGSFLAAFALRGLLVCSLGRLR